MLTNGGVGGEGMSDKIKDYTENCDIEVCDNCEHCEPLMHEPGYRCEKHDDSVEPLGTCPSFERYKA